ncbi:MAG: hypothetical protein KDB29_12975 [Planctomycetes bacterium]|nr:hypothetical protein [Planctomycetota bacterium]
MPRWIAAVLVLVIAIAFSAAQDSGDKPLRFPFGGSKSQIPFDVIQVDGQTAWRVAGRGNVKIEELVAGYTSATGKLVSYDGQGASVSRETVPYVGPDSGIVVTQNELGDFVSGLIQARGLTLVGHSGDKVRVVTNEAAVSFAEVVEVAALDTLPDSEWVTIARSDLGVDDATIRYALERYRGAGVWMTSEGSLFVASGQVAQLRNISRLINVFEQGASSDGREIRAYELGATLKAADAARVIETLFQEPTTRVQNMEGNFSVVTDGEKRVNVSAVPGANRLVVRASSADHSLVKAALEAMK